MDNAIKNKISFLEKAQDSLWKQMEECVLCPRKCKVNRIKGQRGICGAGKDLVIYSAFLHRGEEPPISGRNGSGAIFFSGCNLRCIYCQNYKFSHHIKGHIVSSRELAEIMLRLQDNKAHNINLITATHFLPLITEALLIAFRKGLSLPIVYNTSGYETINTLKILGSIIDIYLTDMKYIVPETAYKLSSARDYPRINKEAVIEMLRQKKYSRFDKSIMREGLIIRHLILPGHIEESKQIILWIKKHILSGYMSIMTQYRPYNEAYIYPELKRKLTKDEYIAMRSFVNKIGVEKGWFQEFNTEDKLAGAYIPSVIP